MKEWGRRGYETLSNVQCQWVCFLYPSRAKSSACRDELHLKYLEKYYLDMNPNYVCVLQLTRWNWVQSILERNGLKFYGCLSVHTINILSTLTQNMVLTSWKLVFHSLAWVQREHERCRLDASAECCLRSDCLRSELRFERVVVLIIECVFKSIDLIPTPPRPTTTP